MIKMIALDLDNTLLMKDLTVPQETLDVLHEAMRRGVRIVIASGRMHAAVKRYAEIIGSPDPMICCNGAEIYSGSGELIHDAGLSVETVKDLVTFCSRQGIYAQLYWGDSIVIERWTEETEGYPDAHRQPVREIGSWTDAELEPSPKALLIAKDDNVDSIISAVSAAMGGRTELVRSSSRYVEVISPGVSKGSGLEILAGKLGIDMQEVMACGDNMNDMSMVSRAGVGVAVANALPELKESADYVTRAERSQGVAEAVRKYVLSAAVNCSQIEDLGNS